VPRSELVGQTDYRHQTLSDIVKDLEEWCISLNSVITIINKNIEHLKINGYWQKVPFDFESIIVYALKYFSTSFQEITSILKDVQKEIGADHVKRIRNLGKVGVELNSNFGTVWHQDYPITQKQYGNEEFKLVEQIYSEGRNMAADMIDLVNVAERLEDFIGEKYATNNDKQRLPWLMLRPNFYGIGVDIKRIIKWFGGSQD
jgi:hypothetical protein